MKIHVTCVNRFFFHIFIKILKSWFARNNNKRNTEGDAKCFHPSNWENVKNGFCFTYKEKYFAPIYPDTRI